MHHVHLSGGVKKSEIHFIHEPPEMKAVVAKEFYLI
jgi:hypothetical protein